MAERRRDPTNHPSNRATFTHAQFVEFYGSGYGNKMWKQAAGHGAKEELERRKDPTNHPSNKAAYTRAQFVEFYGAGRGGKLWAQADDKPAKFDEGALREAVREMHTNSLVLEREREEMAGKIKGMADRVAAVEKSLPAIPAAADADDPASPRRGDLQEQCRELHTEACELRRSHGALLKQFDALSARVIAAQALKAPKDGGADDGVLDARGRSKYRLQEQCREMHSEYLGLQHAHDSMKKDLANLEGSLAIAEKLEPTKGVEAEEEVEPGSPRGNAHTALLEECRALHTENLALQLIKSKVENTLAGIADRVAKLEASAAKRAPKAKEAKEQKDGLEAPEEDGGSPRTNSHFSLQREANALHSNYLDLMREHAGVKKQAGIIAERIIAAEAAKAAPGDTGDEPGSPRSAAQGKLREQCRALHTEYTGLRTELGKLKGRCEALSGAVTAAGGPAERRRDPTVKKGQQGEDRTYTYNQFLQFYGAKRARQLWRQA